MLAYWQYLQMVVTSRSPLRHTINNDLPVLYLRHSSSDQNLWSARCEGATTPFLAHVCFQTVWCLMKKDERQLD